MNKKLADMAKEFPQEPGVYLFYGEGGKVIYVGKAKNLKSRVGSYFSNKIEGKTRRMVSEAKNVEFIKVDSEFEALILEGNLVKKYMPKFNSQLKDDKSPLYIGFTDDKYPRVITLRQTQLEKAGLKWVYGPYIDTRSVKRILRYLRRSFPYCTHRLGTRACVYSQIKLCNPCPNEIEQSHAPERRAELRRQYMFNLRAIRKILEGNIKTEVLSISRQMKKLSAEERFEEAEEYRVRLQNLHSIISKPVATDGYLQNPNFIEDVRAKETHELQKILGQYFNIENLVRIECFDVAHMRGSNPSASMVVFRHGEASRGEYRHFKIRRERGDSDYDSMKEVIGRRMKRDDWEKADLTIVDGGKPQVKAAIESMGEEAIVVGLAKSDERLVFYRGGEFFEEKIDSRPALYLVQRIRDEAHRFARRLHHKRVARELLMH